MKLRAYTDKKFADLTTFHIGGRIKYYFEVKNNDEICEAVIFAKERKLPIFIIGGGSDFLAADRAFEGVVIKFVGDKLQITGDKVTAGAGMEWDKLVGETVMRNLQGIECLSGIPGTVGAAPIQNIGAYGQELKDTFVSLSAYDIENGKFIVFDKEDCKFDYRESIFKRPDHWQKFIIMNLTLKLNKNAKPEVKYESLKMYFGEKGIQNPSLKEIRDAVLTIRSRIFQDPKVVGNAGSFFKSPIVDKVELENLQRKYPDIKYYESEGKFKLPAGWILERAGWKGKTYKEAGVSPKHALVLINPNNKATASEVIELSDKIIEDVKQKFRLTLEREVQLINF